MRLLHEGKVHPLRRNADVPSAAPMLIDSDDSPRVVYGGIRMLTTQANHLDVLKLRCRILLEFAFLGNSELNPPLTQVKTTTQALP